MVTSERMRIDMYRGSNRHAVLLSVPSGTDLSKISLPTVSNLGTWEPFQKNDEIAAGEHRIGVDAADVIAQIKAKGFALHGKILEPAKVRIGVFTDSHPRESGDPV